MRFEINLAQEPFRRTRPMIVASVAAGAALSVLLAFLVYVALAQRRQAIQVRLAIDNLQRQLQRVQTDEGKLNAVLYKPENAEVLERNLFLNALILRKSVSWTKIYSDLEVVMPHNVRLIQVRPQVVSQNEILLNMVLGAQSVEPMITMVMNMEKSPVFGATTVHDTLPPSQTEPLYRVRVSVNYAQKL